MNPIETNQEKVTTIETQVPKQVVTQTTKQVDPLAKGETHQKVFNTKKKILRFNQIVWYILGFIEVLLAFRVVLKALGASQIGFTSFIYAITNPFASPFRGILGLTIAGDSLIEWSTIIAGIVYLCIAWGFVYLIDLITPITPEDVETQGK